MFARFFKKDQEKKDQVVSEITFTLGHPLSKGIPWNKFSEVEIQGILKIHFERLGFKVVWRHLEDPANENGIDLECTHIQNHKKIIIAVKKKPNKPDLGQLLQLSQHDADCRVYLYLNGAAQSFREQMVTFNSTVEFWDEKLLESMLDESGLTIWLKIDNSLAIQAISSINTTLFSLIKKPLRNKLPAVNKLDFRTLWDLKDRAVTLSKCATLIQLMFEDPDRFGKMNYQQIQNLQIWCLDYLYLYAAGSLQRSFDSLPRDFQLIFPYIYERTKGRSNWLLLTSVQPEFTPGNIMRLIEHKFQDNSPDDVQTAESKTGLLNETNLSKNYFNYATREFRCLGCWADGLEYTINDIFEEFLSEVK